ncbi:MAG: protein-(glutamine-N5) methyltransferase, release factor-specific [Planctomycetota bacterium]|nr:MAG: protein-(glutamine-N5) methyltransferase, release factor-specific [Planctomycetota bacterium]
MSEDVENKIWNTMEILDWATNYFKKKNIDTPRLDAQLLLSHCLKISKMELYAYFDRPISVEERTHFKELIKRRIKREPVAYILGTKGFWKYDFKVNKHVLIPRPDSEVLIEKSIDWIKDKKESTLSVIDIGTGSGCLAISLKKELPDIQMVAVDISKEALEIAKENATSLECEIEFIESNLLSKIKPQLFDLIISNPPYISSNEYQMLQEEITQYEPILALVSENNGLEHYEKILKSSKQYLKDDGLLLIEIGDHRKNDLLALAKNHFIHTNIGLDLSGNERVLECFGKKDSQ